MQMHTYILNMDTERVTEILNQGDTEDTEFLNQGMEVCRPILHVASPALLERHHNGQMIFGISYRRILSEVLQHE